MRGNSFGQLFRIHTFGESHGPSIGVVIDGCPAGLALDLEAVQQELDRRRPGQSSLTTDRQEADRVKVLSGILDGLTLGTPIALVIANRDSRSQDYAPFKEVYRPSHADFTWEEKFGIRDHRGGGRSSARETAARVAAGAIARQLLQRDSIHIRGWVEQIGPWTMGAVSAWPEKDAIEAHPTRCPEPNVANQMATYIQQLKEEGDSTGGVIRCVVTGLPTGLGEPVFDKLHADLAKAMLSINACKGFAIGSGFSGVALRGSEHNDQFILREGNVETVSNRSGGVQGGISNGMPISFSVAFKPTATIRAVQQTLNRQGETINFKGTGRHDPCVVPRAVPIVEAMTALVLADHSLRQKSSQI